jgi:hypothetical protein
MYIQGITLDDSEARKDRFFAWSSCISFSSTLVKIVVEGFAIILFTSSEARA